MYYQLQHKIPYTLIKIIGSICGIHYFRIIYSGLFGLSSTTEGKSLGICTSFRYPLEKLCHINALVVNLPLIIVCLAILGIYHISTNAWQVALFTLILNTVMNTYFLISYYKSYWRT